MLTNKQEQLRPSPWLDKSLTIILFQILAMWWSNHGVTYNISTLHSPISSSRLQNSTQTLLRHQAEFWNVQKHKLSEQSPSRMSEIHYSEQNLSNLPEETILPRFCSDSAQILVNLLYFENQGIYNIY